MINKLKAMMNKRKAYILTWLCIIFAGVLAIWEYYEVAIKLCLTGLFFLLILLIFRKWMA